MVLFSECVCDLRLQMLKAKCNVSDNSIERVSESNPFWIGIVNDSGTYQGLILYSQSGCPFDYCVDNPVKITLDNLDVQCDHNHSNTLCGACKDGYSIVLGTLHCMPCDDDNGLALILAFAVAGVALVAAILILNLPVAAGTINGLIFYANIVQGNRSLYFPPDDVLRSITVFIAWLNLDFGIEMCFYNGMDAYAYTWLQFLYPFYLWFLIGLIIVVSRYSRKIAGILGNNPVATLFLLSYFKLLDSVVTPLSRASLEYPNHVTKSVWLYDGTVPYFGNAKHIALGIFSILALIFLFLPYTFLLLFGQWLQAYSHWRVLSWLNKIKPFVDAFHAPYKKETRYWTGPILILRSASIIIHLLLKDTGTILPIITSVIITS